MTDYTQKTCREFVSVLASSRPAPGGGGAAALVGAIGTALGHMVASLTVGKKKYADIEEELNALIAKCRELEDELMDQVPADEADFMPLAEAYAMPKDDPRREEVMEAATLTAMRTPIRIMELCCEAVRVAEILAARGSRLAVSDAGCAAVCLKAAMEAASLNVYVNSRMLKDRKKAEEVNAGCEEMLDTWGPVCDRIYSEIRKDFLKDSVKQAMENEAK